MQTDRQAGGQAGRQTEKTYMIAYMYSFLCL